jgi:hypothetical protein
MSRRCLAGAGPRKSGRRGRTGVIGSHSKAPGTVCDLGASRSAPAMKGTPEQQVPRSGRGRARSSAYECLLPLCRRGARRPGRCRAAGRQHASLATGRPATIEQILPPGRDLAGSASAGRRGRLRDLAGEPFAIGRRQVTVTECNQQTVTNSSQYAHIADLVRAQVGLARTATHVQIGPFCSAGAGHRRSPL